MQVKLGVSLTNVNKCPYCGNPPDWTNMAFECGMIARPVDEFTLEIYTKCSKSETLLPEMDVHTVGEVPQLGKCTCSMDQIMRSGCQCGGI